MLEILGYMFVAYAAWRIVMQMIEPGKSGVELAVCSVALIAIGVCGVLINEQAQEVQRALLP